MKLHFILYFVLTSLCVLLILACQPASPVQNEIAPGTVHADRWPAAVSPVGLDADIERRIDVIMSRMTLRQKIGQIIQADIGSISPEDLKTYPLGAILNGGDSAPGGDNRAPAQDWLALADAYYTASLEAELDGGPFIPLLWGTDAVHGHNNIVGATIFPHNIGLGAMRDPALMQKIGQVTAREIRVTGQEWTFAPTLAVPRDDRWGRTYEGFSEDPSVAAKYAPALVLGLQGPPQDNSWLTSPHVIATAKHFIGDGGTQEGKDQGDNISAEAQLRDIHGAGYPPAINAGVQVVMASFNSWHGEKVHGRKDLLTDVLKDRMGFDGFVIGDWNGHGQIEGCSDTDCRDALHAGVDMYMAPDSWRDLFDTLLKHAERGTLDEDRLDDAVRRILRVKIRSGLFEAGRPSSRPFAGNFELLSDPAHKDVARQAVRQSLVLLKNEKVHARHRALPLSPYDTILIAGSGADNIGQQTGGWTLTWQGAGNSNADFPGGSSFYDGVKRHTDAAGGTALLSEDGGYDARPDAAIIVFGEVPYAEYEGDLTALAYKPGNTSDLELIQKFKADGVPVIAVFLSGRPLWVSREINAADAFVAAWLPGSEGGYAADVLFTDIDGRIAYDFTGQLPFSWPRSAVQTPLNFGDENYNPLFPLGYGLSYAAPADVPQFSEDPGN